MTTEQADDDERVSEDQLRLLVAGAQKSGGIEAQEGQMINQVLNMQVSAVTCLDGVYVKDACVWTCM